MLAYVGAFSYGLYLLHQPYVLYFAERLRDMNEVPVSVLGGVLIVVLTCLTIPLERYVNQLTNRILDRKKERATEAGGLRLET